MRGIAYGDAGVKGLARLLWQNQRYGGLVMSEKGRGDREFGDALDWYEEWDRKLAEQGFELGADGESWLRRLNLAIAVAENEVLEDLSIQIKRELVIELRRRIETVKSFRDLRQVLDEWLRPGLSERDLEDDIELPESLEALQAWAKVYYKVIVPMRRRYKDLYEAGVIDSTKITVEEARDALMGADLGISYGVRTIRKSIKAGDAGKLEKYR